MHKHLSLSCTHSNIYPLVPVVHDLGLLCSGFNHSSTGMDTESKLVLQSEESFKEIGQ